MFDRFAPEARAAVVEAQHAALALHHNYIGTEHLLLRVLADADTAAGRTLAAPGVTAGTVRSHVVDIVGYGPRPRYGRGRRAGGIEIDLAAVQDARRGALPGWERSNGAAAGSRFSRVLSARCNSVATRRAK